MDIDRELFDEENSYMQIQNKWDCLQKVPQKEFYIVRLTKKRQRCWHNKKLILLLA